MDYQVETIGKTIILVFIGPVIFCILSNNCKMKPMVNVETFMLAQLEHLHAYIIHICDWLCKSDFCCHKHKATVMFTATITLLDWYQGQQSHHTTTNQSKKKI